MSNLSTSPIVVVSNRLPFIIAKNPTTGELMRKQCAGGLVTAVAPVVVETGGLWVGWPGIHLQDANVAIPESDPSDISPTAGLKSEQVLAINMDKKLFDDYYNGCCNNTFWPLFHSMPDRALFQADKWEAYKTVNQMFAELTVEAVRRLKVKQPDSTPLVWIHDYHLLVAADSVRAMCDAEGMGIKMAFFLHIPMPSWDIMRLFPWDDELLQGILGCDSVGFHIEDYCLNFIDCCHRRLGCRIDKENMLVEHQGRTVSVNPLPISIPFKRFEKLAEEAPAVLNNGDQQLILGVDRLDYTKGLVNRLRAFEILLETYPEHIEKVTFLQVAVPSRTDVKEYQDLKEEMDQLVGKINGRFSTANWSPIRYIFGCVSQAQLAAFYRDSSVGLISPLRDGMNLVAKEFVACQTREPGVLILSPFAGAGSTMLEALLVNPYELVEMAKTINRALKMPKDERELRMKQLRKREKQFDVNYWLRAFLKSVDCLSSDENGHSKPGRVLTLQEDDFSEFLSHVTESSRLALLLDYDGTLAPIAPHPDLAVMPAETRHVLERLSNMPDVHIAIISGRSLDNVKDMVGIENCTYAGNHGLDILHPDGTKFVHPVPEDYSKKFDFLFERLQEEVGHSGAWVENKGTVLTFHYREVPQEKVDDIVKRAREIFAEADFPANQSRCALEAKPPVQWDKGRAAIYILRTLFGVDWCDRISTIFAGDDKTDEDAMQALQGMAVTFRVTTSSMVRTAASHRLPDTDAVLKMLKWIERRMGARELPKHHNGIGTPPFMRQFSRDSPIRQRDSPIRSRASSMSDMKGRPVISEIVMNDKTYQAMVDRMSPMRQISPTRTNPTRDIQ